MDLIFNNQIVKVINMDSEPFFYGSDLAKMLNYARPGNALETHVSEENEINVHNLSPGLRILINEIGVYELIFGSNLPQALMGSCMAIHWLYLIQQGKWQAHTQCAATST